MMKKYLPYILIGVVIGSSFLSFFSFPQKAEAVNFWDIAKYHPAIFAASKLVDIFGGAGKLLDITLGRWWSLLSQFVFSIVSIFVTIAGYVLDYAIEKGLSGEFLRISAVNTGWGICRDVANLFFIFILLYIAIATILQLSSYNMKALLARLIIIALLVNFSLVITRVIIDGSNILAGEFYKQIKVQTTVPKDGGGFEEKTVNNPSMVFMEAIKLQTIFSSENFAGMATSTAAAGGQAPGTDLNNFKITMIYLGGTIVVLLVTFVFFAAAIFFIIRTVALIILMILAPLAFLFMVLPKTQEYASKWWGALFKYSFFAPAYLFMVYLSAQIISDPNFAQISGSQGAAFGAAFSGNPSGFGIIFSFIIIIVLMIASLIVAQTMGVYGASTVMNWGKSLKKAGQSYAGRVGKRYVGRAAAVALEKLEKSGGGFAKTLKGVPFLQRGLARTAQLKKKEIGTYEKQYAGYDIETLKQLEGKFGTTAEARVAMERIRRKKEAQKANIEKENENYDRIVGNEEKGIKGKLPEAKKTYDADKAEKVRFDVEVKASEMKLQKDPDDEKVKYELVIKMQKRGEVEERIKNVDKMEEEKRKTEENRARRREFEGLEERISKAEAAAGERRKKSASAPEASRETKTT